MPRPPRRFFDTSLQSELSCVRMGGEKLARKKGWKTANLRNSERKNLQELMESYDPEAVWRNIYAVVPDSFWESSLETTA
eukprot:1717705-Pleurochrysis_carterae.AAC.1